MKKLLPFLSIIFVSVLFLHSCKKIGVDENYTETIRPVLPDLTTRVNASVAGFITDENGAAMQDAIVTGGSINVVTDAYGYFRINNTTFGKSAGFVKIVKPGYFTGTRTFLPIEAKENFIRLQLIPKTIAGTINAQAGGTVSTAGALITIPANAVVVSTNNIAYSGTIMVSAHWLDPANQDITPLTMPGDLRGIDAAGYLNILTTYGMLAVELSSDAGELLQIAPGKKASLSFPIPSSLQSTAPLSIPLWYFDESNGLWKQEGTALKNGNNYEGDVNHFSYWNCDVPSSQLVNFTAQIIDMSLRPMANVAVSVALSNAANAAITSYTDTNGIVSGMIPANSSLLINVKTGCNVSIYSQTINTTTANVDLGSIKIDPQLYGATFTGIVNNCAGQPVTDGYLIIAGGFNQVISIQQGMFNSSGVICGNSSGVLVAFDRTTSQQSSLQNINLVSGSNNFGTVSACNASTVENITYILDGVTHSLDLPQHLFNGIFDFAGNTTSLQAIDLLNGSISVFDVSFAGAASPGTYALNNSFTLDRSYQFVNMTFITVSAYGLIGEFITAGFSGQVRDMTDGTIHTFSCSVNIRRDP